MSRISLSGLRREEIADYIELSAGRPAPDAVVEAIHARTEGNPLFVAETVRLLTAEGQLERAETATVVVPTGVREAIDRRVERLSPDARAALTVASVLGREFEPDVLERLEAKDNVARAIDESIRARLVTAAPGAPGMLRFSHALVRDALYEGIPAPRRRVLHERVATELERRHRAEPGPHFARLAHHFFEASSWEKTVEYARLGAERAAAQLAYEEAARLYRLALLGLERKGDADTTEVCNLLLGLGDAQARGGDEAGAQETFLRAAEVARACGPRGAARAGRARVRRPLGVDRHARRPAHHPAARGGPRRIAARGQRAACPVAGAARCRAAEDPGRREPRAPLRVERRGRRDVAPPRRPGPARVGAGRSQGGDLGPGHARGALDDHRRAARARRDRRGPGAARGRAHLLADKDPRALRAEPFRGASTGARRRPPRSSGSPASSGSWRPWRPSMPC